MAWRTSHRAVLVSALGVLGALTVLGSACLTNIDMSPLGYGCSVSADCHGVGVCSDAGLCVLDAGAPNTAVLYRIDHGTDPGQVLLWDDARIRALGDAGWDTSHAKALCYVRPLTDSNAVPVYEMIRPEIQDWLFTTNASERKSALAAGEYDGGEIGFYAGYYNAVDAGAYIRRYEHLGYHHYTFTAAEGAALTSQGWETESVLFSCDGF